MAVENNAPCVVAVGASAGGVEALTHFTAGMLPDLLFAILVALHMPTAAPSVLARILDRNGPLPAAQAVDGAPLEPGTIQVAVPNRHLLLQDHRIVLSEGPTENGHRPAINALFRSVAQVCGRRSISVLLSGVHDDGGTLGSAAIRSRGGTTIAQSPTDALFPAMPLDAIEAGVIEHEVAAIEMAGLLKQLADRVLEECDARMRLENRIAMAQRLSTGIDAEAVGPPSRYACPDCNGSLITVSDGNYRCHVEHACTANTLLRARDDEMESALWVAMRSLQDKAELSRRLADRVDPGLLSERYQAAAGEAEHAMAVLGHRLSAAYEPREHSG